MADKGRISHDKFGDRINMMKSFGYAPTGAAENVALNYGCSNV
jgi:uncharacterized protein YkwD